MFTGISYEPQFLLTVFLVSATISAGLVFGAWLMRKVLSLFRSKLDQPNKEK